MRKLSKMLHNVADEIQRREDSGKFSGLSREQRGDLERLRELARGAADNAEQEPGKFGDLALEKWRVEVTDTMAGEANYSWRLRYEFQAIAGASRAAIMRRAKAIADMANVRGVTTDFGDSYEFRPYRQAVVMFVQFVNED